MKTPLRGVFFIVGIDSKMLWTLSPLAPEWQNETVILEARSADRIHKNGVFW